MKKKILIIFGTRPEAIKLAPLIHHLNQTSTIELSVCVSSQHVELLNQVLDFFKITPEFNLNIMTPNQSLFDITTKCLSHFEKIINKVHPSLIIVQGDTSTAFAGALAGYYAKIPVAHIEAGLRTNDNYNPFPEEVNRKLIAQLATFHFAPTEQNKKDLINEGINENIWVVGNTVIDALKHTLKIVNNGFTPPFSITKTATKKIILVTAHRRENMGTPFKQLCEQLIDIAKNPNYEIIFSLHLNPEIQQTAQSLLKNVANIRLINPQTYPNFIWLMSQSNLIITDSGGVQEEAPYLGIPVLITRKQTERLETMNHRTNKLIDLSKHSLTQEVETIFTKQLSKTQDSSFEPYGEGKSAESISAVLESILSSN